MQAGGVEVMSVERGSPAEVSGVREGDVLVTVCGRPVMALDELQRLLSTWTVGQPLPVRLLRRTEVVELAIVPSAET
jgi:S1-C subfamily serine protease